MVAAVLLRVPCKSPPLVCMSEPRRRGGGTARMTEERPLDDLRRRHDALPLAFLVEIDLDPEVVGDLHAVGRLQHGERQVALAGRRPEGGGDVAGLLLLPVVDPGTVRRLVAGDLQADEQVARAVLRVLQEGAAAVEMALVEIDEAVGAELEGRASARRS